MSSFYKILTIWSLDIWTTPKPPHQWCSDHDGSDSLFPNKQALFSSAGGSQVIWKNLPRFWVLSIRTIQKEEVGRNDANMERVVPTMRKRLCPADNLQSFPFPQIPSWGHVKLESWRHQSPALRMHVCPAQPAHAACPGRLGLTEVGGSQYKRLKVTKLHINQIRAVLNCFQAIQKKGIGLSGHFAGRKGGEKRKKERTMLHCL